jgi:hypothetical protein
MKAIILLIAIYILNLIDYWQTMYAIQIFGTGVEANPIARFLIENNCGGLVKFIGVPMSLAIIGIATHFNKRLIWTIYVLLALYGCLVIHNFIILSQAGIL